MKTQYLIALIWFLWAYSNNTLAEPHSVINDSEHWWSGISFTPGVGLRHLGLDVVRKSDGFNGNLAQGTAAKLFWSFTVSSDEYQFADSNYGVSLRWYNSAVTLDHQFYDFQTTNVSTGSNQGERVDVGTSVSGSYSYIVPAVHYKYLLSNGRNMKVALGWGLWDVRFSGDIILTANNQPSAGGQKSAIDLGTDQQWAYIFLMSYQGTEWLFEMSVGGPDFSDQTYKYQVEEVSIIVGKKFTL